MFLLRNIGILNAQQCVRILNSSCMKRVSTSSSQSSSSPIEKQDQKSKDENWLNVEVEGDIDERIVPKPVSVLPDHVPQNRKRQVQKPWWKFRYFVDINTLPLEEQEYTKEPEYPPIFQPNSEGTKKRIRLEWYDAIRKLPSPSQKIYEITKHYGHLSYCLEPVMKLYNALPAQKYITRTHLLHQLPDNYLDQSEIDDALKQHILSLIASRLYSTKSRKSSINFKKTSISQFGFSKNENEIQTTIEEDIVADLVWSIHNFKKQNFNVHIDYNPFVGASWWVSDFPIPFKKKKWFLSDTVNQCFMYKGNHSLHIRAESPLPKVVAMDDDLCLKTEIPKWNHNLLQLGVLLKRHNILSLPGFWPGQSDGFDFPYLLSLSRELIRIRKTKGFQNCQDDQDILDGMAITSGFSWLTSMANNLGFTIYDRLTYPLVTNIIITDGQYWSFYVYQLNNHCFHEDIVDPENNPCNLCWSSGDMKLFDSYDNGTLTNVNHTTLHFLVKVQTDINYELQPYLSADDRPQQDKDELNYSLRRKFSNYTDKYIARRKKTNLWETIYKNHKDAPIDVKRIRPKIEMKYPPFFKN